MCPDNISANPKWGFWLPKYLDESRTQAAFNVMYAIDPIYIYIYIYIIDEFNIQLMIVHLNCLNLSSLDILIHSSIATVHWRIAALETGGHSELPAFCILPDSWCWRWSIFKVGDRFRLVNYWMPTLANKSQTQKFKVIIVMYILLKKQGIMISANHILTSTEVPSGNQTW